MAETIELFVKVQVNSQEEVERLMEANYSGLISDIISMWLRHGQAFTGMYSAPMVPVEQTPIRRDPDVQLQRVETEVGKLSGAAPAETPKPVRPAGLAGRNRMRRT